MFDIERLDLKYLWRWMKAIDLDIWYDRTWVFEIFHRNKRVIVCNYSCWKLKREKFRGFDFRLSCALPQLQTSYFNVHSVTWWCSIHFIKRRLLSKRLSNAHLIRILSIVVKCHRPISHWQIELESFFLSFSNNEI